MAHRQRACGTRTAWLHPAAYPELQRFALSTPTVCSDPSRAAARACRPRWLGAEEGLQHPAHSVVLWLLPSLTLWSPWALWGSLLLSTSLRCPLRGRLSRPELLLPDQTQQLFQNVVAVLHNVQLLLLPHCTLASMAGKPASARPTSSVLGWHRSPRPTGCTAVQSFLRCQQNPARPMPLARAGSGWCLSGVFHLSWAAFPPPATGGEPPAARHPQAVRPHAAHLGCIPAQPVLGKCISHTPWKGSVCV